MDTAPQPTIDTAIDTAMATPRRQLQEEMSQLTEGGQLPGWTDRLAEGDPETLRRIGGALRDYHHALIAPIRDHINAVLNTEYARRAQTFLQGGSEALLASFEAPMRWESPVLHMYYPVEHDLHLRSPLPLKNCSPTDCACSAPTTHTPSPPTTTSPTGMTRHRLSPECR